MRDGTTRRATRARHEALVALVRQGGLNVDELAQRVGVSASTVRRDLSRLQAEGRVARTYGGALARSAFQERSFGESARLNVAAKAAIASAAAEQVQPGTAVFLDAGTTCLALAELLGDRGPLTVVTRGLEAALLLARAPGVEVIVVGGHVQPLSHGVVGPLAAIALDRMGFDIAFLGADVVDPVRGLGEPRLEEIHVKELAAGRARRVTLLADSSKLRHADVGAWLRPEPSWLLVTDDGADPAALQAFSSAGVETVVAEVAGR